MPPTFNGDDEQQQQPPPPPPPPPLLAILLLLLFPPVPVPVLVLVLVLRHFSPLRVEVVFGSWDLAFRSEHSHSRRSTRPSQEVIDAWKGVAPIDRVKVQWRRKPGDVGF